MRRRGRARFGLLLLLLALMALPAGVPAAASEPPLPLYSGQAQLGGPLQIEMTVEPPVVQPGDRLTLNLALTNLTAAIASPALIVAIPAGLSLDVRALPAGATYNVAGGLLGWQPLVMGGGKNQLSLPLTVNLANMAQAEQTITAVLRQGDEEQSLTATFWVGVAPQVAITVSPTQASVGQPVQLLATVNGPGPFSYLWRLGDGRTLTVENPQVTYPLADTYSVALQVTNPLATTTAAAAVHIVPEPAANFTILDATPGAGRPVAFVNQSGGQPPLGYLWDFGDGATSADANPVHVFAAPGTYPVRLAVTNDYGQAETTWPILVGQAPVADMVIEPATTMGLPVLGQAFGDETVTSFLWDMGDGRIQWGEQISHVYRRAGDFLVTMVASNDYSEMVVSRWVHVEPGLLHLFLPFIPGAAGTIPAGPEATTAVLSPGEFVPLVLEANPQLAGFNPAEQLSWYINEARRLYDLPPLQYDQLLGAAAQAHTADMAAVPGVLHTGSDGSSPAGRLFRHGYRGGYAGEATAWGFPYANEAVEFWVNSPPHRTMILGQAATQLGVGYVLDLRAPNVWYWTAEFGSSWLPPVEEEILPAPPPDESTAPVITLLLPLANAVQDYATPITFAWDWPRPLQPDQQFTVYLYYNGQQIPVGTVLSPLSATQYGLQATLNPQTLPAGLYGWQVKLETRRDLAVLFESQPRPLTLQFVSPSATSPASPSPTLPPAETPAPSPPPSATPTPMPPLPTLPVVTPGPTEGAPDSPPPPPTATPTPTGQPTATPPIP